MARSSVGAIHLGKTALLAALAACIPACGKAAVVNVRPLAVQPGQGAVFGRVSIWQDGREMTGKCRIAFTGRRTEQTTFVPLDASGWVFASLPEGPIRLSLGSCAGLSGVAKGLSYPVFNVAGRGKATYFGRVGFRLQSPRACAGPSAAAWGGVMAGVVGGLVAAGVSDTICKANDKTTSYAAQSVVVVDDRSDEALVEYESRYGAQGAFELFVSLAGGTASSHEPPAPEIVREGDVVSTEVNLSGIKLDWRGTIAEGRSSVELRVRHRSRTPTLQSCHDVEFTVDGVLLHLPVVYREERDPYYLQETLEVGKSADLAREVAGARSVTLSACGMIRVLSPDTMQATAKFVAAYDALARTELARRASFATPTEASSALPIDEAPAGPAGALDARPEH